MLIGVPKEIKIREYRVGLVPSSVRELIDNGHKVIVEHDAGAGIGCTDEHYKAVGATIIPTAAEIFAKADMIVKVKEPQPVECKMLREGQILFTYLHLAPDPEQTKALVDSKCIAIAYETVTDKNGKLPLLSPMSEVAGRLSIQMGAHCLEKRQGGAGVLLGGVPGVGRGKVAILGAGVVGTNAMLMAMGMGADVTILDKYIPRLQELDTIFGSKIKTMYANNDNIEKCVIDADLVVGGVLLPGAAAPKVVTRAMLKKMRPGSVLVDVSIDQGGCFETSRPTSHDNPTYVEEGIVHYCVTNMPGAVPRTSAFALNNATLPFSVALANKGYKKALLEDPHLLNGLNVCHGHVTCEPVAKDLGLTYKPAKEIL
ncbi:MAG: alanine dehydrogenase [Gammaproteobacteria bacterium]